MLWLLVERARSAAQLRRLLLNQVSEIHGKSLQGKENSTGMPEFRSIKLMRKAASIATTLPAAQTRRNGGNAGQQRGSRVSVKRPCWLPHSSRSRMTASGKSSHSQHHGRTSEISLKLPSPGRRQPYSVLCRLARRVG